MMPARAHSYWVRGCGVFSPPPCGEGPGVGVEVEVALPPPRLASLADPPHKGEGETARQGFGVLGKLRARCLPVTLPLSTGWIGRPSYSSIPPRSFTQAMRLRASPFSTSIVTFGSV